jgi:hypothetical protein
MAKIREFATNRGPLKPLRKSRFEVSETVVDAAPWRKELQPA